MDHASRVGIVQRVRHLAQHMEDGCRFGQRIGLEPRRQAVAFHVLHHHIGASAVFENVIDADDIGMFEHGRGAGIAQQTAAQKLAFFGIVHREVHRLDRYLAVEQRVRGEVNHTHGASSQLAHHRVSAKRLAHGPSDSIMLRPERSFRMISHSGTYRYPGAAAQATPPANRSPSKAGVRQLAGQAEERSGENCAKETRDIAWPWPSQPPSLDNLRVAPMERLLMKLAVALMALSALAIPSRTSGQTTEPDQTPPAGSPTSAPPQAPAPSPASQPRRPSTGRSPGNCWFLT